MPLPQPLHQVRRWRPAPRRKAAQGRGRVDRRCNEGKTRPEPILPQRPARAAVARQVRGCQAGEQRQVGAIHDRAPAARRHILVALRAVIEPAQQPTELGHRPVVPHHGIDLHAELVICPAALGCKTDLQPGPCILLGREPVPVDAAGVCRSHHVRLGRALVRRKQEAQPGRGQQVAADRCSSGFGPDGRTGHVGNVQVSEARRAQVRHHPPRGDGRQHPEPDCLMEIVERAGRPGARKFDVGVKPRRGAGSQAGVQLGRGWQRRTLGQVRLCGGGISG